MMSILMSHVMDTKPYKMFIESILTDYDDLHM